MTRARPRFDRPPRGLTVDESAGYLGLGPSEFRHLLRRLEAEGFPKGRKGGQFIPHAKALPGNPFDGHTLKEVIEETEALTGREIERIYVDKGYVGHDTPRPNRV